MARDFFGNVQEQLAKSAANQKDSAAKAQKENEDAVAAYKVKHAQAISAITAAFDDFVQSADQNDAMAEYRDFHTVSNGTVNIFYLELKFALKKGDWKDPKLSRFFIRATISNGKVSLHSLAAFAGPTSSALLPFGVAKDIAHSANLVSDIGDYAEDILKRAVQYQH